MKSVKVNASSSYDIFIDENILDGSGGIIKKIHSPCKILIVTDSNVRRLYYETVSKSLIREGFSVYEYVIDAGEHSKSFSVAGKILNFLSENNFTRSDIAAALGGGVVGDITGFCSAVYLRGIKFIQIPTTFLAAIDSSVGGKTGVNLEAGKNLAGAFHQPSAVITDCSVFSSLSEEIFAQGVAEAVKYGVIKDEKLFLDLKTGAPDWKDIVFRCVSIKRDVVERDEFDNGERQLLNFGHTIGHAVEKRSNYGITHGEAVAMGMVAAAKIAYSEGISVKDYSEEIAVVLKMYGLPVSIPFGAEELAETALSDKKRSGDFINLILPVKIGECVIKRYSAADLKKLIEAGLGYGR